MAVTDLQQKRLARLEERVQRSVDGFADAGRALAEIRDEALYVETHGTFDRYCRERWGFDRTYAFRLIKAAEVADALPIGNRPGTEAQARELSKLPEGERDAAMAEAAADGKPTAAKVRAAVDRRDPKRRSVMQEAVEYAAAHPRASVDQVVKATSATKAMAEEAIRRRPKLSKRQPARGADELADRRRAKSSRPVWVEWLVERIVPRDDIERWAASVPDADVAEACASAEEAAKSWLEGVAALRARLPASP
jgi:hypothetical protein